MHGQKNIKFAIVCILIYYTKPNDGPLRPKHVAYRKQILSCDVSKLVCSYEMVLIPEKEDKHWHNLACTQAYSVCMTSTDISLFEIFVLLGCYAP